VPFKSVKQKQFMRANHPGIAKRWDDETRSKGMPAFSESYRSRRVPQGTVRRRKLLAEHMKRGG